MPDWNFVMLPLEVGRLPQLPEEIQRLLMRQEVSVTPLEPLAIIENNILGLEEKHPAWESFLKEEYRLGAEKRKPFGDASSQFIFFKEFSARDFYPGYDEKGREYIDKKLTKALVTLKQQEVELDQKAGSHKKIHFTKRKIEIQKEFLAAEITKKRLYGGLLNVHNPLQDFQDDKLLTYLTSENASESVVTDYTQALKKGITPAEIALLAPTFKEEIKVKLNLLIQYRASGMEASLLARYPLFTTKEHFSAFNYLMSCEDIDNPVLALEMLKDVTSEAAYYVRKGVSIENAIIIHKTNIEKIIGRKTLVEIASGSAQPLEVCCAKFSEALSQPTNEHPNPLAHVLSLIRLYRNKHAKEEQAQRALGSASTPYYALEWERRSSSEEKIRAEKQSSLSDNSPLLVSEPDQQKRKTKRNCAVM